MPHRPNNDVPEEFEPGAPPVEPDEGPVPTFIPDGPEHEPDIDPAAHQARLSERARRQAWEFRS
jgi:hypothetical protein